MIEKFRVGETELIIAYGDGVYHVLNSNENEEYDIVFTGHYDECVEYCEKQEILYNESSAPIL